MRSRCKRQGLGGVKVKVEVKVTVKVKLKATGAIDFGRAGAPEYHGGGTFGQKQTCIASGRS